MRSINKGLTVYKAREFLEQDLPALMRMADRDVTSLSSPQLSWSTSHATGINRAPSTLIDHWSADIALEAIHDAAHHIPQFNDEREIFILTYFKHWTSRELQNKFVLSSSTLRRRKNDALVEFAQRLDVQKVDPKHNCDWLHSLVVYYDD